jgi:hypothetical protein
MRKLTICIAFLSGQLITLGQSAQVKLPQVLPASPEATAIAKGGQLSVGLYSGAPSATIPLYEIKLRNLSIPVALNYSSNGFKVDEIPGRTGIGWNLSMGGAVTRVVHGKPDEGAERSWLVGTHTMAEFEDYYNNLASPIRLEDNEPDEFMITAPGLSSRFILDTSGVPVTLPFSNLKVEIIGGISETNPFSEFVVTNPDGIAYRFGGTGFIETTITHTFVGQLMTMQQVRTAFFLKSIKLPEGDSIKYNYRPVRFATFPGISQGIQRGLPENLLEHCQCNTSLSCPYPATSAASFHEDVSEVMYSTAYLTQITGPNGLQISLGYQDRPDGSGDKRIDSINVRVPQTTKIFKLLYDDPTTVGHSGGAYNNYSAGEYNKRFFLKEVQAIKPLQGTIPPDTVKYTLDYVDLTSLPPRLSFSQDFLGFYNGANNTYFLPVVPGESEYWGIYATADRNFHGASAEKGMLHKITYPTGGYDEFLYEPNTIAKLDTVGGYAGGGVITKSISGSGDSDPSNSSGTWINVDHYTDTLLVLQDQLANITIHSFANPGCDQCSQAPSNTVDWAWLRVLNVTTNTVVWTELIRTNTTITFQQQLYANNIYKLKLTVKGLPNAGFAEIRYNRAASNYNNNTWINVEAGGVRVKQINSYDPVAALTNSKYYTYASFSNQSLSSGKSRFFPNYMENYDTRLFCERDYQVCPPPAQTNYFDHISCYYKILSSNSAQPIYLFDNNHLGYEYVIESDDANKVNGAIEHAFIVDTIVNRTVLMGNEITNIPNNTVVMANGNEKRTRFYNASNGLVKEVYNYYTFGAYMKQVDALAVKEIYGLSK